MRSSMTICQPHRLHLLLNILFVVACVLTNTALSNLEGLTLNLIHRDLIYPPTNAPRVASKNINQTSYHQKQVGKINTTGSTFYVEFYIGTPGVRQFASLDTGSYFPWVQCAGYAPGHGHRTLNNVYNESASSSYRASSCKGSADFEYCGRVPGHGCDNEYRCEYNIKFQDSSRSKGHIGFETISFSDAGHANRSAIVSNVLFGCGTDNYNTNRFEDGVFGIGGLLPLTIVKQTQRRFSFCFGSISDPSYKHNYLALGSDARLEGVSIPYELMGGGYGVTFDLIRIGATKIPLPRNFIVNIDSGTTISYFTRNVYNNIRAEITKIIGTNMRRKNSTVFKGGLCYELTRIWREFPNVTIESDGINLLVLNIDGMFIRTPDHAYCLAIKPSVGRSNLLGAVQLQFYNVGFDLRYIKAYFQRKDTCNRDAIS